MPHTYSEEFTVSYLHYLLPGTEEMGEISALHVDRGASLGLSMDGENQVCEVPMFRAWICVSSSPTLVSIRKKQSQKGRYIAGPDVILGTSYGCLSITRSGP